MQAIFEVMNGPALGKHVWIAPGQVLQVGRSPRAELSVPHDSALADVHFTLQYIDRTCRIRPRPNAAVLLNGRATGFAPLQDGDQIVAGGTRFLFRFAGVGRSSAGLPRLSQVLAEQPDPAFAILDAARDPEIIVFVRENAEMCEALLDNVTDDYAPYVPYLISLPADGRRLALLVDLAWGKSWGIFLTCAKPCTGLRDHLRSLLEAQSEDGQRLYFRYYDPRVLRVFLPTCAGPEGEAFFGPITRFLAEGENPGELMQFVPREAGVACSPLAVVRG